MDEEVLLDLDFRETSQGDGTFALHNGRLAAAPDIHEAFAPIFAEVAQTLRFAVASAGTTPVVIPPVHRGWNEDETTLIDEPIARAGDRLHVSWSAERDWKAEWRTPHDGGAVIARARSGEPVDYDGETFAGPDERAAIAVEDVAVTYTAEPPSLQVSGRVRFIACPLPRRRSLRVQAHVECDVPLRSGRFHVLLPVPPGDPENVELRIAIDGTTPPISSQPVVQRIPTSLGRAELSIDGQEFSERVFAREIPQRIRFPLSGYAPQFLTLEFRPTAGEGGPRTVQAHRVDKSRTHVQYHLALDKETIPTFKDSLPGAMLVTVVGQDPAVAAPSRIELVPRLVRAVWEQLDTEVQLRIVSSEVNVSAITGLGSLFDLRPAGTAASPKDAAERLRDPQRIVTNVLLAGGLTTELDDRAFTPAYPRDASTFWRPSAAITFATHSGVQSRIAQGDPDTKSYWTQVMSARNGNAAVLSLGNGVQALIAIHGVPRRSAFTQRIADAHTLVGAKKPFGVFFRGFCFAAQLETLRPSLDEGGLLLKLTKSIPSDDRSRPPINPFLPMRVLRSADNDALAFWETPAPPVQVQFDNALPVHDRIGYVHESGNGSFWSRLPEVDPGCKLRFVTFDNVVFSVTPQAIDFEGWWLPDERGTFTASEPFREYTFDFTEGAAAPYRFELRDGEVRCTAEGRWLAPPALAQLESAIAAGRDARSGGLTRTPVAGRNVELRWQQRDAKGVVLVTATNAVDASEVELYALA
jgi:hypothetical protein